MNAGAVAQGPLSRARESLADVAATVGQMGMVAGRIVMRIMSMVSDKCVGFMDAIERQIGYPAGIDQSGYPIEPDDRVVGPTEAEPGGN